MKKRNFKTGDPILDRAINHALEIAHAHKTVGVETCDLEAEAMEMTLRLMKRYNPKSKCSIKTFIQKPVEGHIVNFLRKHGSMVRMSKNETISICSIENIVGKNKDDKPGWEETIADSYAEERKRVMEDTDQLNYAMSLLKPRERELVAICFQLDDAKETMEHYIKRKKISEYAFRYKVKVIINKLQRAF